MSAQPKVSTGVAALLLAVGVVIGAGLSYRPQPPTETFIVDRIEHTEDELGAGGWVVLEGPEPMPDSLGVYPMYDVPAALLPLAQAGDSLRLSPRWVEEVAR